MYPVADPIIRTDINERAYTTLQEGCNIILCREHPVHGKLECVVHIVVAGGEIRCDRRINTYCLSDVLAIEEGADISVKT